MSRESISREAGRTPYYALVLFVLATTPRAALAQLSVSQPDVLLKSNLTSRRSTVLRITNQSDQPAQASLQLHDWHRDETGASRFLPLGTGSGSCREHLKITPASIRIEPHETEHVRVAFDGEYDKSCWAMVSLSPNAASAGIKIYVQPEWAKREGSVERVSVQMNGPGARCLDVLFRNTGDAHLETFGAVEIRNSKQLVVATVNLERFPIAPTDQRRIKVDLPRLPPGRYTAVVVFDYAGGDIAERQTQFEIN